MNIEEKKKLYKIYWNGDTSKFYVRGVVFGENPFIQVIPAWYEDEIARYEEDKAKEFVRLLNEEHKTVTFNLEED
jgi:hypothetical protein